MAATALDDAKRFLDLHPWATTDVDNPVELLADLVREVGGRGRDEPEPDESVRVEKLLAFIKGLRESCKISEQEYRGALALVAD